MAAAPKAILHPVQSVRLRTITEHINSNVAGRISWRRLVEVMRAAGELKRDEELEAFVVDDEGVQFYVRRDT
jgi:hypothetical protein